MDYGVKAEERLQNLTTLNHDATGTSLVGGFRKDSLALTMKAIGNNTAKIGEGPAAPKTKKSSNYDRDRPAQSFCQSCRKSNVDHYARNCPRRPMQSPPIAAVTATEAPADVIAETLKIAARVHKMTRLTD